jgi:hypothetical protein
MSSVSALGKNGSRATRSADVDDRNPATTIVTTVSTSRGAWKNRRTSDRSSVTPTSAERPSPSRKAIGNGTSVYCTKLKVRIAPAAPMAVWAKLMTRRVR